MLPSLVDFELLRIHCYFGSALIVLGLLLLGSLSNRLPSLLTS
jgi:hypothetical protein